MNKLLAVFLLLAWRRSRPGRSRRPTRNKFQMRCGRGSRMVWGGPFVVFRDGVLDELKVSDEQRNKLLKQTSAYFPEAMQPFPENAGSRARRTKPRRSVVSPESPREAERLAERSPDGRAAQAAAAIDAPAGRAMGVAGRSRRRHRIEDHRRTTEKAPGPCRRDAEKDLNR